MGEQKFTNREHAETLIRQRGLQMLAEGESVAEVQAWQEEEYRQAVNREVDEAMARDRRFRQ